MKIRIWKKGEKPKGAKGKLPKLWFPTLYIKTKSDYVNVGGIQITAGNINYGPIQLQKLSPTEFKLTISMDTTTNKNRQQIRMDDFLDAGIVFFNAEEIYVELPIENFLLLIAFFVGLVYVTVKLFK